MFRINCMRCNKEIKDLKEIVRVVFIRKDKTIFPFLVQDLRKNISDEYVLIKFQEGLKKYETQQKKKRRGWNKVHSFGYICEVCYNEHKRQTTN